MNDDLPGTAPAPSQSGPSRDDELVGRVTDGRERLQPESDPRHLERFVAAVAREDYSAAEATVRDGWFDLLVSDQVRLRRSVDRLPHDTVRQSPLLAMLTALAFNGLPHRRVKALRLLVSAARTAESDRNDLEPIDRALVLTAASVSFRLIGLARHGITVARSAVRILLDLSEVQRQRTPMLPRLYAQLGTTLYYGGLAAEALDAFEHGLAEIPDEGYPHGFSNLAMLAGIHALRGELVQTTPYLDLARQERWPEVVRSAYSGTFYRIAEAIVALERFDVTTARRHLEALVHDPHNIEHWIAITTTEALMQLVAGRPGAGLAAVDAFAALRGAEGRAASTRAKLAPTRALLQLGLGSPDSARAVMARDAKPGVERLIGLARAELTLGHHGAALQHLRRIAGAQMSPRLLAEQATIEAAALLRFSERPRARAVVEHLGAVLERTGQRLAATLVPEADYARLRAALLDAGYEAIVAELPESSWFPDADPDLLLTDRESAVLHALTRSSSSAAIAAELTVSVNTVKTHLRNLYRKLGARTRDEAIAIALDRHLIAPPPHDDTEQGGHHART